MRLNLFKRLEDLNKVISLETLEQRFVPALKDLSEDKNWRIKLSVVEQYPALAKQLGEQFFTDKLLSICLNWLSDCVYSIRIAAIENLKQLSKIFGSNWADRNVLKKLIDLKNDQNYLHRLTTLFGIAELSQVLSSECVQKNFVPVLHQMSKDRVPNIRMNVAKTIMQIRKRFSGSQITQVENSIQTDLLQILNELK